MREHRCRIHVVLALTLLLAGGGCEKSEDDSEEQADEFAGAAPGHYLETADSTSGAVFPIMAPAPKPTQPLAPDAACVTPECHASSATARHIHGPVGKRACDACHRDDVGEHRYPLVREGDALCTFCHAVAGLAAKQHTALKQGCMGCHVPHVSQAKFLLKGASVRKLCMSCHPVRAKRHTHSVFVTGPCTLCHRPHQSDDPSLLVGGSGPGHCSLCHDRLDQTIRTARYVHEPVKKQCAGCHDPHATNFKYQLKTPMVDNCLGCHKKLKKHMEQAKTRHGAIDQLDRCANCHDAHASAYPKLLRRRTDAGCLQCHDRPIRTHDDRTIRNMAPVLTKSKYLHGPIREGNCSACHDPHAADHASLLKRPFTGSFYADFDLGNFTLCFDCHTKQLVIKKRTANLTGFRNGDLNLHFLHVNRDKKGRTCRSCHEIHGSNLPRHMATDVPFAGSKWRVPIRHEMTAEGGSCRPGCHESRAYDRLNPKVYPRRRPTTRPAERGAP